MKSNKIMFIIIGFCAVLVIGFCAFLILNKKEVVLSDAQKFKQEFESYNGASYEGEAGKLIEVTIPEDNPFIYKTSKEIVDIMHNEDCFILFGYATEPLMRNSIEVLIEALKERVESLKEFNPMMGHRGCRLAVTYPEIAKMQTRAVIEAALKVKEDGIDIVPEIMIPLVGDEKELAFVKKIVTTTADQIIAENNSDLTYKVGTMIEIPRAALTADEIAKEAEFFSFGTNDLTQMTYGFSRDDAAKFLKDYYDKNIFEQDPFATLDQKGVGKLMKMAVELGRETRPDIKLGICGEHGGDPATIEFCDKIGLTYVSCSPYRVPVARLAAARAKLINN